MIRNRSISISTSSTNLIALQFSDSRNINNSSSLNKNQSLSSYNSPMKMKSDYNDYSGNLINSSSSSSLNLSNINNNNSISSYSINVDDQITLASSSSIKSNYNNNNTSSFRKSNPNFRSAMTPGGSKLYKYLLFICLTGVIVYLLVFSTITSTAINGYNNSNDEMMDKERNKHKVTVLLNTFKRPNLMEDAIAFYASCSLIKHIYIIWSESTTLPPWVEKKYNSRAPRIAFLPQPTPSLNNRFRPIPSTYPHTNAVFSVDDDMRVNCLDLERAYSVWESSQQSLVGYMPRIHIRDRVNGGYIYRCWWRVWWHGAYSIILTKAALFHYNYLNLYTSSMSQSIRNLVDTERNCEDIAMQFLISNVTNQPPIYVKGSLGDLGGLNGISTSKGILPADHMDRRSLCLNELIKLYDNKNPLVLSHIIVDAASNGWTNRPSTWLEYISSDLWKFD